MLQYLSKYLFLHKKLSLPGIGSFTIDTQPAELNFAEKNNKIILAFHSLQS